jgi:hypothetical protein
MKIKVINELHDTGILKDMFLAGFLSAKTFEYREIYLWVDAQIKTRGVSKNKAVLAAEVFFNKSEATIWKALKCFT